MPDVQTLAAPAAQTRSPSTGESAGAGSRHRALQSTGYAAGQALLAPPPAPSVAPTAEAAAAAPAAETTTPTGSALPEAPALLTLQQLERLSDADLLTYLHTRPASHLDGLRGQRRFLTRLQAMSVDDMAAATLAIILRTPDQVVDRAGATAEAIRILSSQLRDKEIMANLLRNDVRVVIVPRNQLMTDLPEFAAQRNTFTFDGRPWDTTRGLGGRNTAIAEENLLGVDVEPGAGTSRLGWDSQASMEAARSSDANAMPQAGGAGVITNNPGVYCSGYSTTNHEFFHTIHQYGLTSADSSLIQSEYNAKHGRDANEEWADGPRKKMDDTPSENYCSSTVYEYFAQTGCAFQGTNTGADPYTQRPRNNGRAWVTTHEPGLTPLLTRICASTELTGVNPRDARRAAEAARSAGSPAPTAAPAAAAVPAAALLNAATVGALVGR